MLAIRVNYLMGRVYSSVFDDGDTKTTPEWPPHPSRFFSALVAAWGEGGGEEELRPALEWMEQQGAPVIYASDTSARKLVKVFVPVNDAKTLPDDRPRKQREFPSASLADPDVYFVWNADPPPQVSEALETILKRTSSLGHSASLVDAGIVTKVPADQSRTVWQPDPAGNLRMRVPSEGRLQDLIDGYRRFERDPSKVHRPSVGATALYGTPHEPKISVLSGAFDRMIVLRRDRDNRDKGPRVGLASTLSITSALRNALLSHAPQPVPEYISGHAAESSAERPLRSERPHIALVPLPFVDFEYATGEVMGVAALLPKSLAAHETEICWDVMSRITNLKMNWGGDWEVSLTDVEEHLRALREQTWSRPASVWSTVTPFVFDRYPKDPWGEEAERFVRESFARSGFPEPVEIDLHYNPWHLGVPKAANFPAAPTRPGKPRRYHCHVRATFAHNIRGPVVAGAGRFYGYGLFLPMKESRQ